MAKVKLNDSRARTQVNNNSSVTHLQPCMVPYLMSSADQVKVMTVEEFANNIGTKSERYPPIIFTPALDILVGVRPQQITQQTCRQQTYGRLLSSFELRVKDSDNTALASS